MKSIVILLAFLFALASCDSVIDNSGSSDQDDKGDKEKQTASGLAPKSIKGRTLEVKVSGGTGGFTTSGKLLINFFVNNTYSIASYTNNNKDTNKRDKSGDSKRHSYKGWRDHGRSKGKNKDKYHDKTPDSYSTGSYSYRVDADNAALGIVNTSDDTLHGKVTFSFLYTRSGKATYQAVGKNKTQTGTFKQESKGEKHDDDRHPESRHK